MIPKLRILLLASGFSNFAAGLFGPIYAIFVENIGGDILTAGTAFAAYSMAAGALLLLIAKWEDRHKHLEVFIIVGYMLSCLGYFGYLFVKSPLHLFLVQIIFGIGLAVTTPAYDGLYSKNLEHDRFASQWGAWEAMTLIVGAIAAVLGGIIAEFYGFRILFNLMLASSILGLLVSLRLVLPRRQQAS